MSIWVSCRLGQPSIVETPSTFSDGCGHPRTLGVAWTTMGQPGEDVRLSVDCGSVDHDVTVILDLEAAMLLRDELAEAVAWVQRASMKSEPL